jgi:hypothetical protein
MYQEGITPKAKERPYRRYTRVTAGASVTEILLAKNRPVKVSSTLSGTSKSNVNDDDASTIWQPETSDTEKWCWLHLEASYCINRIQLEFPVVGAYRYTIEVSADDINWTKVIDQTESAINDKIRTACGNLGRNVSFIRIKFTSDIAGLAEVKVGGATTLPFNDKLFTGTIIGTSGSWNNNLNATKEAAFDFDANTFFDAPSGAPSPQWVGLDLGYQAEFRIEKIRFTPRSNLSTRMVGGKFEVANKPDFSDGSVIYTVTTIPSENTFNVVDISGTLYTRYVRYVSPTGGNGNIAEMEFLGVKKP